MNERRHEPVVLPDLLDVAAERSPDDEALTDGKVRLTWREYRDRSGRLGGALSALEVGPGDRVGILLPKSVDSFVAVHAILRLGAVVVPVDWFSPSDHVRGVIEDAGAIAIVSTIDESRFAEVFETTAAPHLVRPDESGPPNVTTSVAPDDPAYIVYTSGSTGRPKGIVHTHASALAYARHAVATYRLDPTDRLANIAPLHFDQSTFELYAAPLAGAAVVVVPDGVLRFPASTSELVANERITVWYSVPFAVSQLTTRGAIEQRDLSTVRWVLFGGESFPPRSLADAMRALPSARFSNVYGPAEVNQCTFHHLDAPPHDELPIPIGRPWRGAEVVLVDHHDQVVHGAATGQLLVSTDTMMDRYWNRPDLTAAAISIRDEIHTGRRWYRTGDLVERRDDDTLVFVGRLDHQVKIRGHRIELEAIEAVIAESLTNDSCVVAVDRGSTDRLVAMIAPAPDRDTRSAVAALLRSRLPRYAVPDEIVGLDSLPRTDSGKIDRSAVAALLEDLRESGGSVLHAHQDPG